MKWIRSLALESEMHIRHLTSARTMNFIYDLGKTLF